LTADHGHGTHHRPKPGPPPDTRATAGQIGSHSAPEEQQVPKTASSAVTPLPQRFLTPDDVADLLSVPVKTLYQWRYLGSGPPSFRAGRHLRYDPVAVRRWVDGRTSDDDGRAA
jgi:hypothetical protein